MGIAAGSHDGDVIAASWAEPDRFTEIFERHFDAIYAFTARRLGREVADDVGATVFVEAFAARTRFEADRDDARPWLYGIATNLIRRHRRTAQLSTLPIQVAPDGARVVLRQPDADTALAPFRGGPVSNEPPPPGFPGQSPLPPTPTG